MNLTNLTIITVKSPNDLCDNLFVYGILTDRPLTHDEFAYIYSRFAHISVVENDGTSLYFLDEDERQRFCEYCECDSSFWDDFDRIFGEDSVDYWDAYRDPKLSEEADVWIKKSYELALNAAVKRELDIEFKIIAADHIYDHMIDY